KQLNAQAVKDAFAKIDRILGQPGAPSVLRAPGLLEDVVKQASDAMLDDWSKKLLATTAGLMELPEFHLAGAEEAIRQFGKQIDEVLMSHKALSEELYERAVNDNQKLQWYKQNLDEIVASQRKYSDDIDRMVNLLQDYPKRRYHSMLLKV